MEKKLILQPEEEETQEALFKVKKPRKSVDEKEARPDEVPTESHDITLEKVEKEEETSEKSVKIKPKRKKSKPEVTEEAAVEKKLILQPEEEEPEGKFKLPKRKEPVEDLLAKEETSVDIEEHSIKLEKVKVEKQEETSEESVKIKPKRKKSKPEVTEEAAVEKKLILQPEEEEPESKFKLPKAPRPVSEEIGDVEQEKQPTETYDVKVGKKAKISEIEADSEEISLKKKPKKATPSYAEETEEVEEKVVLKGPETRRKSSIKQDVEIRRHTVDEQSSEILIRKKSKKVVFEDSDELVMKRKESKKSKTTSYSTQEESVESKIIIRDEESEQWIDGEKIDEEVDEDIQFKMKKPRRESFATLETRKLSIEDNQIGINIKKKLRKQSSEESAEFNLKRESRRSSTTSVQSHDLGW